MHTKVKALTSFVHGRVVMTPGQEGKFTKGDAEELVKAGLVEHVGEVEDDENILGEKMEQPVENKMAAAPDNKTSKTVTTKSTKDK